MEKRVIVLVAMLVLVVMMAGCGVWDDDGVRTEVETENVDYGVRPVLFIHGLSGSASQFESQAQRFLANHYPVENLEVFEYNTDITSINDVLAATPEHNDRINAIIDRLLDVSGADQVDLIGHSLGTYVSYLFLDQPANATRVAHYVNVDGRTADALPGGVPTLALWGMGDASREITGAQNDYNTAQSHIQVCTSAESFEKMFLFFNGEAPTTNDIPPSESEYVWIRGKVNLFPRNEGAEGNTLHIFEVDAATGMRIDTDPIAIWPIAQDGEWGPLQVVKGAAYEFALINDTVDDANHYFYREPFMADDYFIRLNTAKPGEGLSATLPRSAGHTNLMIARDKEIWGDQAAGNDTLAVNGTNVATDEAAAQEKRLSALFLFDEDMDQTSNLATPYAPLHAMPFISGLDYFIEATSPLQTVAVVLTPRGGAGKTQTINTPNWPSDQVRAVSVQFRDFVR